MEAVGIYPKKPVFTHGQLYVTISRVISKNNVHVLIERQDGVTPHSYTSNVYVKKSGGNKREKGRVTEINIEIFNHYHFFFNTSTLHTCSTSPRARPRVPALVEESKSNVAMNA